MNRYEIAEEAYLARSGSVSTNGIAAAVDAVLADLRRQVQAARDSAIEGRQITCDEDGTDNVFSAWHNGCTSALDGVLALLDDEGVGDGDPR